VGLYNRLHIDLRCVQCEENVRRVLQFKHGACWLHEYALGDSVQWVKPGVNHGEPINGKAWVPAYAEEPCTACGANSARAEFAVMLADDELEDFEQAPLGHHFPEIPGVHPLNGSERPASVPTHNC